MFGYPNLIRFSWNTSINALSNFLKVRMATKAEEEDFTNFNLFDGRKEMEEDLWSMISD